jgi:hypothetical protein
MPVTLWCALKAGKRVELFVVEEWMHSSQVKNWGGVLFLSFIYEGTGHA